MNNDQIQPLINAVVAAIVTAVVTSDQFKVAVKHAIGDTDGVDYDSPEFEAAVNRIINEEDSLIMFDNDKFKEAVTDVIKQYHEDDNQFEDRVKNVVADMSFTTEASRY